MEHIKSTLQITRLYDIFRGYWKNIRITPAFFALFMIFFWSGTSLATGERQLYYNPGALETITADDGSVWERVNEPGFGNAGNKGIVALKPYLGSLYAITRNDDTGFEIWKTNSAGGWTQISVPGFTDVERYSYLKPGSFAPQYDAKFHVRQNIWGDMVEFQGKLYVAVSSGYQGAQLYGSTGLEIWRFDNSTWEPIVSHTIDAEESGAIDGMSDCADGDAAYTATITDSTKSWAVDQWAGCVLRVEATYNNSTGLTDAGTPGIRLFDIISNTADTLTVQQNEMANLDEYTVCAETRLRIPGDFGRPDIVIPPVAAGDSYTIISGTDENGFGEVWNKSIVDFKIYEGELYATIGLNYEDGTRVWKTADGVNWVPTSDYSFNLFHGYEPDGTPIPDEECPLTGLTDRNGNPVCSSSTNMEIFNGALFTGGTGSSGCNGRGARVAKLQTSGWDLIVDYFVDENETGTNENGFGNLGMTSFFNANFQAWSFAPYDDNLFVSVVRLEEGCRIMRSETGSSADDAWTYAVGGDNNTGYVDGWGDHSNLGAILYNYDSTLYAGTIINNLSYPDHNGADLWKATGPADSLTWTRLTGTGFSDGDILQFESFVHFGGSLYVVASSVNFSGFKGDESPTAGGAKIYRLVSQPCVSVTADQSVVDAFTRHTVTGITTPLPVDDSEPGFLGAAFLAVGDIDDNGITDIVCTSGVGLSTDFTIKDGAVAVYTWDGANLDSWTQSIIHPTGTTGDFAFPNDPLLRDIDGDGDTDIMIMDNFLAGWFTGYQEGIYYLENQGGDITLASNWIVRTIYQGQFDPSKPQPPCFGSDCTDGIGSYHRAVFLDIDGDGLDDFMTTKINMFDWQNTGEPYMFAEWFKKETDLVTYPSGFSGPYTVGEAGGFLFNMMDIDGDGDLDFVAPQFFIQDSGSLIVKGPGNPRGDSLVWCENPGPGGDIYGTWNYYTIDNWYTSPNPMGKGMEVIASDIDNDGSDELLFSNHNHQDYKPDGTYQDRIWPSGIYYLDLPDDPKNSAQWGPVSIDTGDPLLDPYDPAAVANDVYAVDRAGGPYSQGSPGQVRAGDIIEDGYPELVVPGDGKGALYYYESDGSSDNCLYYSRAALYEDPGCMPGEAEIYDIDGDGDQDIVAVIYDTSVDKTDNTLQSSSIFVYENGAYTPPPPPVCGNGIIEEGEECDGDNATCVDLYGSDWVCNNCVCEEKTLVELTGFAVDAGSNQVVITWSTAAETNNAGFNVYRSETANGGYEKINAGIIASNGSPTEGATYELIDDSVKNRKTYYYKLEDIDANGTTTVYGPEAATPRLIYLFK